MSNESTRLLEQLAAKHPAFSTDALSPHVVDALWTRLGARPPQLFAELLRLYSWPTETSLGLVVLYARAPADVSEWEAEVRRDIALSTGLLRAALLPFGRPQDGSYDAVCFDTSRRRGNDCPIVRIDHESVLLRDKPRVSAELSPSTRLWLEACSH